MSLMDLMRIYFGALPGESLNDAQRRYYGVTAANFVDTLLGTPWYRLGGDALYAFFLAGPPALGNYLAREDAGHFLLEDGSGALLMES